MPWNKNDYPDSFKNLNREVRDKAIEIANALLKDGMEEGRAIAIATEKAREYVGGTNEQVVYEVNSHADGWQLTKEESDRAIYVEETKQKLLDKAKPYVNEKNGVLKIHHEDGSLQDTLYEND
ncbi:DUF2188 domain-containing protein [Paenisporosarcina indica]|uniref:DUF2188 domain-containing protein n=1 Tax=Paenisporosarcina indica TaxID=650093 RepID=UPI00094FAA37|nr:DUF2188 domain-containing protein [Paenisporosarcina indica]